MEWLTKTTQSINTSYNSNQHLHLWHIECQQFFATLDQLPPLFPGKWAQCSSICWNKSPSPSPDRQWCILIHWPGENTSEIECKAWYDTRNTFASACQITGLLHFLPIKTLWSKILAKSNHLHELISSPWICSLHWRSCPLRRSCSNSLWSWGTPWYTAQWFKCAIRHIINWWSIH